jgi:hypothetical protein
MQDICLQRTVFDLDLLTFDHVVLALLCDGAVQLKPIRNVNSLLNLVLLSINGYTAFQLLVAQ